MVGRKAKKHSRLRMHISTASEAIDAVGGNGFVAKWLGHEPTVISGWRKRGIPQHYSLHFLVALDGRSVAPQVFALKAWSELVLPGHKAPRWLRPRLREAA